MLVRREKVQEKIKRQHAPKEVRLLHVERWRQSGLSMTAYSRNANISFSNLSKWVRSENTPKFKPVSLPKSTGEMIRDQSIEIIVGQQVKIRIPNTTDSSMIINILKGLMQCN